MMPEKIMIGNAELWHGDCLDVLPLLGPVDVVITDPPYVVKAGNGGGIFGQRASLVNTGGFTDKGVDHGFLNDFPNWFCFCSQKQLLELIAIAAKHDRWNLITWAKPNPVPTCCNKYLPDVEYIVHGFSKGRLFGDFADKQQFFHEQCGRKETEHPNEKPLTLMRKLVKLSTVEDDTVADFYMGSGTTGVAAVESARKFIGIEKERKWFDIACERIDRAQQQGRLF